MPSNVNQRSGIFTKEYKNNVKYVYEIIYVCYDLGFLRSCNEISSFSAIACNSRTAVVDFSFNVSSGFISSLVCSHNTL